MSCLLKTLKDQGLNMKDAAVVRSSLEVLEGTLRANPSFDISKIRVLNGRLDMG